MKLECRSCHATIPAEDINLDKVLAKCRRCNTVFDFAGQLTAGERPAGRPARRAPVPLPPKFTVQDQGNEALITYRWFSPAILFLAFFCLAWDSFLIFWYAMAFKGDAPWIMIVFPIGHLAVGVGLTYAVLAGFLNRTYILASRDILAIRHAPIPWKGNRMLPATDIAQLYCGERVSRGKNGTTTRYELNALMRDGTKVKIVGGMEEPEQVLFLEQEIESRMGIEDRPVGGEMARSAE